MDNIYKNQIGDVKNNRMTGLEVEVFSKCILLTG